MVMIEQAAQWTFYILQIGQRFTVVIMLLNGTAFLRQGREENESVIVPSFIPKEATR